MIPTAWRLSGRYVSIDVPTVVMAGEEDEIVSPSQARQLGIVMPNATLVTVPGAGHMIHQTNPGEIAAALETLEGGASSDH